MRCCSPLHLLAAACVVWATPPLRADGAPNNGVELRFAGHPALACADSRYPNGQDYVRRLAVVVSVVGADDRIRRTFGCFFDGDARQLQAMATDHGLRFINLLPASASLTIPDADCVVPRRGLPSAVFDVEMNVLGADDLAPAGCLMHGPASSAGLASRVGPTTTSTAAPAAPDTVTAPSVGALMLRFQRVSFPVLECRYRAHKPADVTLRGLVQPPDDHFSCCFRYRVKGEAVGALLRYLSAAYGLDLDAHAAGMPVLTLRPFTCAAAATDDADVDFLVTGPSGRSAGCKLSPRDKQTSG